MQRVRAPRLLAPDMSDGRVLSSGVCCMVSDVRCAAARIALRPSSRLLRSFEYFFFSSSRSGCMKLHMRKYIHKAYSVPSDAHSMPCHRTLARRATSRRPPTASPTAHCLRRRSPLHGTHPIQNRHREGHGVRWYTRTRGRYRIARADLITPLLMYVSRGESHVNDGALFTYRSAATAAVNR